MNTNCKLPLWGAFLSAAFFVASCGQEDIRTGSSEIPGEYDVKKEAAAGAANALADCTAPGWASQNGGTTGGGTAAETTVTTYAQLKSAIENTSVKVIRVSGTITVTARLSLQDQSGKTLYGASGARLVSADQTKDGSGIINIKRCSNIVIRNLVFEGPGAYDTDG